MAEQNASFNVRELVREHVVLKVELVGLKWALFRLKCALPFLWLGAKIAGVELDLKLDRTDDEQ